MENLTFAGDGERESAAALLLALALIVLAGSYLYPLADERLGLLTGCVFRRVTTVPCLFCGMTRSFAATARLDLAAALRFHLLGPALFVGTVALAATAGWSLARGRPLPRLRPITKKIAACSALALLLAAWAARLAIYGKNI
ncbi:MAG: DUF2752 domain-containing protein [Candidatus Geothermincolia bacterium]